MNEEELEKYAVALRSQLAERRALWEILQELVGRYAAGFHDPSDAFESMYLKVMSRLDSKDRDAEAKGLEIPLESVKTSVDRFFSELSKRRERGEL